MPNSKQHQEKAQRNRDFLNTIPVAEYPEWAAVAAFYTAVHWVERLRTLPSCPAPQHSTDHQNPLTFVHRRHREIHYWFRTLFDASIPARYQPVHSFNKQFSVEDVQKMLIDECLREIETYVRACFS